jgi:leucyl aminopeptidase
MLGMKCDMGGAATVLGAVQTAAALNLKINVTAVVPTTENSIDANSYKIGDVYRAMNGKTVEITNTDAEGRLVLADAMAYAVEHLKPTVMIDVATLTGAIVIALGEEISGLFCNNDLLASDLLVASDAVEETLWRMPIPSDYKEMLKSDVADMVNSAGRIASSITAALFLQEFCGSVPWAHLDIAGTCYRNKPKHYNTTKATGFGLRLLIDFLERRQK